MMKTWAITDVGLVRKENQDAYRIARGGDVCVVCDGMGGAAGGQIASTLAAETYAAELEKILKPDMTPEQLREASSYAGGHGPIWRWRTGPVRMTSFPIWEQRWCPPLLMRAAQLSPMSGTAVPITSPERGSPALPRIILWWNPWWITATSRRMKPDTTQAGI